MPKPSEQTIIFIDQRWLQLGHLFIHLLMYEYTFY